MTDESELPGAASYRAAGVDYETLDAGKQRRIRTFLSAGRSPAERKSRTCLTERYGPGHE
jgi:hypothetical protein